MSDGTAGLCMLGEMLEIHSGLRVRNTVECCGLVLVGRICSMV